MKVFVSFIEIESSYGHDSFLVEIDGQSAAADSRTWSEADFSKGDTLESDSFTIAEDELNVALDRDQGEAVMEIWIDGQLWQTVTCDGTTGGGGSAGRVPGVCRASFFFSNSTCPNRSNSSSSKCVTCSSV